jgi:hypothetical protein
MNLDGNTLTFNSRVTFTIDGSTLRRVRRGLFRSTADDFELAEYVHAGIAWIEGYASNYRGGPTPFKDYPAGLCLWKDTKTLIPLTPSLAGDGGPGAGVGSKSLKAHVDAIESTVLARFATVLEQAIGQARTTPAPQHQAGSYLPVNGHAVWIPGLGASIPFS